MPVLKRCWMRLAAFEEFDPPPAASARQARGRDGNRTLTDQAGDRDDGLAGQPCLRPGHVTQGWPGRMFHSPCSAATKPAASTPVPSSSAITFLDHLRRGCVEFGSGSWATARSAPCRAWRRIRQPRSAPSIWTRFARRDAFLPASISAACPASPRSAKLVAVHDHEKAGDRAVHANGDVFRHLDRRKE